MSDRPTKNEPSVLYRDYLRGGCRAFMTSAAEALLDPGQTISMLRMGDLVALYELIFGEPPPAWTRRDYQGQF